MGEPSYRRKFRRATDHLDVLCAMLEPFNQPHDYDITEHVEKRDGAWLYVYRAWCPAKPPEDLMAVFGDFLFNARGAIDHLACELVPSQLQGEASFPIFVRDPAKSYPGETPRDAKNRRALWAQQTAGMKGPVVEAIRSVQPFRREPPEHLAEHVSPEDHVLVQLRWFNDADKHRSLTDGRGFGFDVVEANVPLGPLPLTGLAKDGAAVAASAQPREDVRVRAKPVVAVRISGKPAGSPHRRMLDFANELLGYIGTEVFPSVERARDGGSTSTG